MNIFCAHYLDGFKIPDLLGYSYSGGLEPHRLCGASFFLIPLEIGSHYVVAWN
jgi:hypothetical protein